MGVRLDNQMRRLGSSFAFAVIGCAGLYAGCDGSNGDASQPAGSEGADTFADGASSGAVVDGGAPEDASTNSPTRDAGVEIDGSVVPDGGPLADAAPAIDATSASDGASAVDGASAPDGASADDGASAPDSSSAPDSAAAPDDATSSDDTSPADATTIPPVDCSSSAGGAIGPSGAPALLGCTGLYADWSSGTIAATAVAYDPGLHLWSDGAQKRRFISLPPGTQIDTSNMDEWTFPVGTKVWKEFSFNGVKYETRYLNKTSSSNWVYTTYQWSPDGTSATELTAGATNVNGTTYEIPDLDECRTCHMGRLDFVLGFDAIGLSTTLASGLTMNALVASGLLTNPPAAPYVIPGDATSSAALGWLHANCGTACHNPSNYALAGSTGFFMRLEVEDLASVQSTNTYTTGVNVPAKFKEPDGGSLLRIAPGDPSGSCVVFRDGYRDTNGEGIQMPPDDTHVVDTADLATVESWITSL